MHTTDNQGTGQAGWWARLRRDLRVLVRMARMAVSYVVTGSVIRRTVRKKARAGKVYYVDDRQVRRS